MRRIHQQWKGWREGETKRERERERHSEREDKPVWQVYVTVENSSRKPDGRNRRGMGGATFLVKCSA